MFLLVSRLFLILIFYFYSKQKQNKTKNNDNHKTNILLFVFCLNASSFNKRRSMSLRIFFIDCVDMFKILTSFFSLTHLVPFCFCVFSCSDIEMSEKERKETIVFDLNLNSFLKLFGLTRVYLSTRQEILWFSSLPLLFVLLKIFKILSK